MRDFSFGEAMGAGFKLIGRNPLAVLMWGVANFLLTQLAGLLIMLFTGASMYKAMASATASADMAGIWRAEQPFLLLFPINLVLFLTYFSVVNAAVFRAVLEPTDNRSFFLRFGRQELTQALVILCQFVLSALLLAIIIGLGVGAVMATHDVGMRVLIGFIFFLAGFGIYVWLWIRFCFAPPMSFAQKGFRLFESWPLTQGHAWKLFGLGFLLYVILFVIIWIVEVVLGAVMFSVIGFGNFTPQNMSAGGPFAQLQAMVPVWIGFAVVMSLAGGFIHAIVWAPWADAYRQLSGYQDISATTATFD